MAGHSFETSESFEAPGVRQLSIFMEDRVGALMRLFKVFEGSSVRVLGLTIIHEIDCAIVRIICDDNDTALDLLHEKRFPVSESEVLVVELPPGHGLMSICAALLSAEVNLAYAYPLLVRPSGRAVLALFPDDLESAAEVLRSRKLTLMSEEDLGPGQVR